MKKLKAVALVVLAQGLVACSVVPQFKEADDFLKKHNCVFERMLRDRKNVISYALFECDKGLGYRLYTAHKKAKGYVK